MFHLYLRQRAVDQSLGYYEFVIDEDSSEAKLISRMKRKWVPKSKSAMVFVVKKHHPEYAWDETTVIAKVLPRLKLGMIRGNRMSVPPAVMALPEFTSVGNLSFGNDCGLYYEKHCSYDLSISVGNAIEMKVDPIKLVLFFIDLFRVLAQDLKGKSTALDQDRTVSVNELLSVATLCDQFLRKQTSAQELKKFHESQKLSGFDLDEAVVHMAGFLLRTVCPLYPDTYFSNIASYFYKFGQRTQRKSLQLFLDHIKVIDFVDRSMFLGDSTDDAI